MKCISAILILFVGLTVSIHAQAQSLWNGTEFGMTAEQVLKLFPEAKEPKNPTTFNPPLKHTEKLRLDDFVILDEHFRVGFYFKDAKLEMVRLDLNGAEKETWTKLLTVSNELKKLLQSKYGEPAKDDTEPEKDLIQSVIVKWIAARTNIMLSAIGAFDARHNMDSGVGLSISYEANSAEEIEKI